MRYTSREAGETRKRSPLAAFLPFSTCAAVRKSEMRPPVHEPMYTCVSGAPATSVTSCTLSTWCGQATCGTSAAASFT